MGKDIRNDTRKQNMRKKRERKEKRKREADKDFFGERWDRS